MQSPDLPSNESARLQALRSLNILDTAPEERYDRITRIAKKVFDVPIVLVSLVDEHRQWFKSKEGLAEQEILRKISFCGHAILSDQPLIVEDATKDERFADNPLVEGAPNIRFYAGFPLALNEDLRMGTLCIIDNKPREFSPEDINTLQDLAGTIEAEMRNVNMATTDQLTGLSNRLGFSKIATHIFHLSKRANKNISLIYLDLDKFKEINDRYGHHEGDIALRATAKILSNAFREMDVIARLGGDEFCVLCLDLNYHDQQSIEQRINKKFKEHNDQTEKPYTLACSIGALSFVASEHQSIDEILQQADQIMYQRKQSKCGSTQ